MCAKNGEKGCCLISGWINGLYVLYCIYCKKTKGS